MISFRNDYSEGAHAQVLAALEKNNLVTTCGYSMDDFCAEARGIVRARFSCPQADVHFMVGGTIANTTVIAAALRPWEGVIAADTGHINVHETGAIEASGHKVCAIEAPGGKLPPALVRACAAQAMEQGSGVAAVRVNDTVLREGAAGFATVPREGLWRMQTPQAFRLFDILDAYDRAEGPATDDATLFLRAGHALSLVEGGADNFKLTTPADWARAERLLARCGTGFDTHRLVEGRRLVLGGVTVPFARGLLGHSDADVLAHAVMDALLGAAALPDIGQLFPDTDPAYAGADSMALLRQVVARVAEKGLRVNQLDATVIAERPKLAPYVPAMRENLAAACGVAPGQVGLKATTTEGMNDEGRGLCISAQAVATLL